MEKRVSQMALSEVAKEKSWENRRQFDRVQAQLNMQYRVMREVGASPAWNNTLTKNISAIGICFESFHPLSLNSLLEINLSIPFFQKPVSLKARIVRAAEIKPGEIYGVAASIVDISPADRKRLQTELEQIDINDILHQAVERGATDIHLSLGRPPMLRKSGELIPLGDEGLSKELLERMVFSLLSEKQISKFKKESELNTAVTALTIENTHRFRLNVQLQHGIVEAVFHYIPIPVLPPRELGLPDTISSFARKKSGLVIISGLAGSGKTTTCASLIDAINTERSCVIMTFQRPIEYIYPVRKSIIRQREVGVDTQSFISGLQQAVRQDPDVLMLSEVPDQATAKLVLETANNGKLVFLTLSASDIIAVLNNFINLFPSDRHYNTRKLLASCLVGIVFQRLLPAKNDDKKQVAATEILINTPIVSNVIREGMLDKIIPIMENDAADGMRTMSQALQELKKRRTY